jgi:acyl-CoA thioesterase
MSDDALAIAQRTVAGMMAGDRASQLLGMQVTHVAPGEADVTMTIRADMLNGFGICHGGLIAALADSAFAFACNSAGELTVASGIVADFLAPGRLGDVLTARAREVARTGRTGVCDVEVTNQAGQRIVLFRGRSFTLKGQPSVPGSAVPGAPDAAVPGNPG